MPVVNQAHVNQELSKRIGKCEQGFAEMNGYLTALIEQNNKLIRLLTRVCYGLITISVFLLLIVAYGVIGERGLHSVRQTLPSRGGAGEQLLLLDVQRLREARLRPRGVLRVESGRRDGELAGRRRDAGGRREDVLLPVGAARDPRRQQHPGRVDRSAHRHRVKEATYMPGSHGIPKRVPRAERAQARFGPGEEAA